MKITNYEIYKLRKAGLTNQQILTVLEYDETVDQELLLGDIAEISGCRNPAVFMERYFQIDDAQLEKEFQKFPSFWILDDCYPWDLSEIYDPPALLFYRGDMPPIRILHSLPLFAVHLQDAVTKLTYPKISPAVTASFLRKRCLRKFLA